MKTFEIVFMLGHCGLAYRYYKAKTEEGALAKARRYYSNTISRITEKSSDEQR